MKVEDEAMVHLDEQLELWLAKRPLGDSEDLLPSMRMKRPEEPDDEPEPDEAPPEEEEK